jgi:hypothetical protein
MGEILWPFLPMEMEIWIGDWLVSESVYLSQISES